MAVNFKGLAQLLLYIISFIEPNILNGYIIDKPGTSLLDYQ